MTALPMFPLGSVLLPGFALPLHIFEQRYRDLVRHCLETDTEFGVVLIERGSEVGGGDVRAAVGVSALIVDHREFPDGRFAVVAMGTERIRINRWLGEDPYPLADVEPWPDPRPDPDALETLERLTETTASQLDHVYRMRIQAGLVEAAPPIEPDPEVPGLVPFGYRLAGLSPLGASDLQSLLAAETPEHRIRSLLQLLIDDLLDVVRAMELDEKQQRDG